MEEFAPAVVETVESGQAKRIPKGFYNVRGERGNRKARKEGPQRSRRRKKEKNQIKKKRVKCD